MAYSITGTTSSDLAKVAMCYRKAFEGSLSAALGDRYARKMLAWFLSRNDNFLFHITDDATGRIAGFCGGMLNDGVHKRGSASEMIQYAFNEAAMGMVLRPWLVLHPEMRSKYKLALRNVRKKLLRQRAPALYKPGEVEAYVGLVVIGVHREFQNRGLSKLLLEEFESRSKKYGYRKIKLSVKSDNAQAVRAYEKSGWQVTENRGASLSMTKMI